VRHPPHGLFYHRSPNQFDDIRAKIPGKLSDPSTVVVVPSPTGSRNRGEIGKERLEAAHG